MLGEGCNDIPVIDFSAILQAVWYIPSDHGIGISDDDEENDDEQRTDEQNERNIFTFSFDDEDF